MLKKAEVDLRLFLMSKFWTCFTVSFEWVIYCYLKFTIAI